MKFTHDGYDRMTAYRHIEIVHIYTLSIWINTTHAKMVAPDLLSLRRGYQLINLLGLD